ncbi:hypothetical protein [Streptomyces sp. NPDC127040]|uniref:hypothetical protein n=1 Tax=Streptomyces sp. NPDC127040 TaxID=3347116 RepID=UPI0036637083
MKQIEDMKQHGIAGLVTAAREGVHTLPQEIIDDYAALEAIEAEHTDRHGRISDPQAVQAADRLAERLGRAKAWGNANALLVGHVQPALTAFLADLAADLKTAGRHAVQPGATIDMLTEPDDVRAAIVRLHSAITVYGRLRASWEILRRGTQTTDPLGLNSPLAEIGNLPDLVPDWQPAYYGRAPWPWQSTVFHVRMGWLLANGAHIWLPTPAEQEAAWRKHNPAAKVAA